jgi:ligand-binding sensor domain-containing protein/signal transduction histidine kinase
MGQPAAWPRRLARSLAACIGFFLAAAHTWALDPRKPVDQFIIDQWNSENSGIPMNSVPCMAQTRDGYLWLGTFEGLCRFDGLRFAVFDKSNTPQILNNGMLVMAKAADGALWIGTPNGLLCLRGGRFRNYTVADGLPGDFILSLCFDPQGVLWVGTTRGLGRFQDGSFTHGDPGPGGGASYVSALSADRSGVLWLGTSTGLFSYIDGRFTAHDLPGGIAGNTVWSLCAARDGTLWVGTAGGGLFALRGSALRAFGRRDGLASNDIRVIFEDSHGTLWVGTDGGGLSRLEGRTFSCLGNEHGLSNDSVRALVEDREGSLWVGTTGGGLCRLKDDRYIFYNSRNGLPVDQVRSVFQDREGDFWIGTVGGGLVRYSSGEFRVFGAREGLRNLRIWSIAQGPDDAIWFGTYGGGLHCLRQGKITVWSTANGMTNDIVRAVLAARDGSIWAGTNGGGIDVIRPDGSIVNYGSRNGLRDDFIYAVAQDRQGAIWAGSYNGDLYRFRDGAITTFSPSSGPAKNAVWVIHPDDDGSLWIGTNGSGLVRFRDGAFSSVTSRDGLFNDVAFQILEDDRGFLWMNCNKGVYRVSKKELNDFADGRITQVRSYSFGISEGVRGVESTGPAQPAGCRGRDGRLWFATLRGVTVVDPDYSRRNEHVPPVFIETMTVDGREADLSSPLVFGPGRRKLEFSFTSLSFLVPEKNRFRTMLVGFDGDWSGETAQRQVSYTNLPPGRYTLRVIASNNDGLWNHTGASLDFVLRPYFFQALWFEILAVCGVLLLVVLAFRWRFRRLRLRGRELERMVDERTAELVRVNEELLRANRMQDELQRIAVHDLKNPLQAIMGAADLIKLQGRERAGGVMLAEKISLASQRMLTLINEMLEISRFERGDIQLELQSVDIGQLLMLAADGFTDLMRRKEQRLELDLEPDCLVSGDLEWLKEIFDNLISNAVKFSPFQSRIAIAARRREGKVLVSVRDQGPGFTEEDKVKLFKKFQRLSARPTGGESSTGLGLSIAELLVRKHQGRIWAESEPGGGSTFFVELPGA